ncbi:MAG: hypothetical protein QE278_11260 [Limnobacter sp.]|nr:hypothetical protein [Limnobacter sp.]
MQFPSLQSRKGSDWLSWLGAASQHIPELSRAFQCLEVICFVQDQLQVASQAQRPPDLGLDTKPIRKAISKYLGQTKCPSAQASEKLTVRAQILQGWAHSVLDRPTPNPSHQVFALQVIAIALERFIPTCEGADDRSGALLHSVRGLSRYWLSQVSQHIPDAVERAYWIYPLAILDQAAVIQPDWWWKSLAACDLQTVFALVEEEVNHLSTLQPSTLVTWKTYDQRWRRLRLKSLLSYLGEKRIRSELLRKSVVDDFEAAEAINALTEANRHREAMVQGEEWMRRLPRSSVLAEALFGLYLKDGWDEEGKALLQSQFEMDPNPKWKMLLKAHYGLENFSD